MGLPIPSWPSAESKHTAELDYVRYDPTWQTVSVQNGGVPVLNYKARYVLRGAGFTRGPVLRINGPRMLSNTTITISELRSTTCTMHILHKWWTARPLAYGLISILSDPTGNKPKSHRAPCTQRRKFFKWIVLRLRGTREMTMETRACQAVESFSPFPSGFSCSGLGCGRPGDWRMGRGGWADLMI